MINKIDHLLSSRFFLAMSCVVIFLLSIFLRSTVDVGGDTGIYLELGKKIAHGGKYYYDFFESNFPLSFYIYAFQYWIADFLNINPIIMSEIVVNMLVVMSICWSAKILQGTVIGENKSYYNLLIIAYTISFFLRIGGLQISEFGTKTSFLLVCLYPYISFSFQRKTLLSMSQNIQRGILMGIMGCLKPHYLIIVMFVEFHRFWQKKSLAFFFEIDKLVMVAVGFSYLLFMIQYTPEFFEFMVPMWKKVYGPYDDMMLFIDNSFHQIASKFASFGFIFLIFSRLKFSYDDKVLACLFVAVSLVVMVENIGTIDQGAVFYAIATICFFKLVYDLITSQIFSFSQNRFIIVSLMILPIFDMTRLPWLIFSITGFVNVWWLIAVIYPILFYRKMKKERAEELHLLEDDYGTFKLYILPIIFYFSALLTALIFLKYVGNWSFIVINLLSLFIVLFFFEKIYSRFYRIFSPFFVFVVTTSISFLFYSYVVAVFDSARGERGHYPNPNPLSDAIAHYSSLYAPDQKDGFLVFSDLGGYQFPITNYLGKNQYYRGHLVSLDASLGGNGKMFSDIDDHDSTFVFVHFLEGIKKQITNEKMKIFFIEQEAKRFNTDDRCLIGFLEYYFMDPEIRTTFFENFRYEGRILFSDKVKSSHQLKNNDIFDQIKPSKLNVIYDYEIYVRK